jgi:hypothetical protein
VNKFEASPEAETAAAEPDEMSVTKSKVVIAEVHNAEAAEEDEVSEASFKSAQMSPTGETEAQKSPPSAKKVTTKPSEGKLVNNSPLKAFDPMAF